MFRATIFILSIICIICALVQYSLALCTNANTCPWFGDKDYLCQCAGNVACNTNTGDCPGACDDGFFGPACQYVSVSYTASSDGTSLDRLTDNDDTTCNDANTQTITVMLDKPTLLSWMRLVIKDSAQQDDIQVSYNDSSTISACPVDQAAVVDGSTLDISCPTPGTVSELILSGPGVGVLCSLYISGGHNIALKETDTVQSSQFRDFYASYAVDGLMPTGTAADYCTHTLGVDEIGQVPSWWTLTFSSLVDINKIEVYNRPEANQDRLIGFSVNIYDESNTTVFSYTDPNIGTSIWKTVYTISGIGVRNVKMIEVILPGTGSNVLTICELVVYGESACPSEKYGLDCEKICNCKNGSECFDHSGGCPAGCAAGYTGSDCTSECPQKTFGDGCNKNCSTNCAGSGLCNHINGSCDDGCVSGYLGPTCEEVCPAGKYGQDCGYNCTNCDVDKNNCHHVTGVCNFGCNPGYLPPTCSAPCSEGQYGKNCSDTCSTFCFGDPKSCDHVTGSCDNGCEIGYKPDLCKDECVTGQYGQDCLEKCSEACFGVDNACHHVNGSCDLGCDPGYQSPYCNETCDPGYYGQNCNQTCIACGLTDVTKCHHVTGCTDPGAMTDTSSSGDGAPVGAIVGPIVGVLVIVAVVAGFLLWRRRKRNGKPDVEQMAKRKPKPARRSKPGSGSEFSVINPDEGSRTSVPPPKKSDTAISVGNLKTYLLDQATNALLRQQFESVPQTSKSKTTHGAMAENKKKNRFLNIWPYDKSRVILSTKEGNSHSDYINATHITEFLNCRRIIASQGPNDFMLDDFLRMLWEKNVDQIVMLTNKVEKGKRKCSQYWPVEGVETFENISVELLTTRVYAEYTIRHLRLSQGVEKKRDLIQYHFTGWPDKSVPDSPWGLVDLYHRVMAGAGTGTLLVHCSAGCGRTGTFIALHHLLREAEVTGSMDFLSTLKRLRADRTQMVQTLEQYKLLHRAALIGHMTSQTIVPVRDMYEKLHALDTSTENGFSKEFAMTQLCVDLEESRDPSEGDGEYANSKTTFNKLKNRLSNILPKESHRASVIDEDVKGDIYINAVLVPNFTKDRHDLLTQLPLPTTVTDLWRLVSMYNVSLMVVFDIESAQDDETIGAFLPKNNSEVLQDGVFEVELTEKVDSKQWLEMKLTVSRKKKSEKAKEKPSFVTCLLVKATEMNPDNWLEIMSKVKTYRPAEPASCLYMCRNGATLSGLACVQSILLDRLDVDQCLAVPLVVGAIKAIRPQVIPTVDQYKLLYEVLRQSHDASNVYGNVDDGGSVVPLQTPRPASSNAVLQLSDSGYEYVDGKILKSTALAVQRQLREAKSDRKPAPPLKPNNVESSWDQKIVVVAKPELTKKVQVHDDERGETHDAAKLSANVKASNVDVNIAHTSSGNHRASTPATVERAQLGSS